MVMQPVLEMIRANRIKQLAERIIVSSVSCVTMNLAAISGEVLMPA
jgi:hypothetical protein